MLEAYSCWRFRFKHTPNPNNANTQTLVVSIIFLR